MTLPNSLRTGPDEHGRFGIHGGRFVAETLMPLILELEQAYEAAKRGDLPTIRIGRRYLVPTAPLRRMLGLDQEAS